MKALGRKVRNVIDDSEREAEKGDGKGYASAGVLLLQQSDSSSGRSRETGPGGGALQRPEAVHQNSLGSSRGVPATSAGDV